MKKESNHHTELAKTFLQEAARDFSRGNPHADVSAPVELESAPDDCLMMKFSLYAQHPDEEFILHGQMFFSIESNGRVSVASDRKPGGEKINYAALFQSQTNVFETVDQMIGEFKSGKSGFMQLGVSRA